MPDPDETGGLSDFRTALEAHGGGMRSPLFQWMYRNHDALIEMLFERRVAQVGRLGARHQRRPAAEPARSPIARGPEADFSERFSDGFTGPDGRPLRPETVRKLWLRVRRRHGTGQARGKVKPVVTTTASIPVVTAEAAPEPVNADEVLARFRAKVNERSGRKP